jgi:hypothetical protein
VYGNIENDSNNDNLEDQDINQGDREILNDRILGIINVF